MQVHPPRSNTFNGSVPSFTSSSSYSTNTSSPSISSGRMSISRLRAGGRAYTHPNPPIDEGFYATPSSSSVFIAPSSTVTGTSIATASPTFSGMKREKESSLHHIHASQVKAKIKPVLKLMKENASGRTSRGSLDLSVPGGGEAAKNLGLGIYGSGDYIYGYDDLDSAPRARRSISGTGPGFSPAVETGGYTKNGQYIHPRRQMPRPYTPTAQGSDEHDSSEDEVAEFNSSRGYYSGEYSRGNSVDYGSRRAPPMRLRTDSAFSTPILRTSTTTTSQMNSSPTCSPITPITTSGTGLLRPSARRTNSGSGGTTREPSPSFAASVTAARLAWDAKEAHKEEKRERKRRKSEQKEREKAEIRSSKDISRSSPPTMVPVWSEEMGEKVDDDDLEEDSVPELRQSIYNSRPGTAGVSGGTGKKWGMVSGTGVQPAWASEKKGKGPGLKKRWLGFVVWIRISLVKMGRKFGGSKSSKARKS